MANHPLTGAYLPTQAGDPPAGGTQITQAVNQLSPYTVPRFTSTADRDSKVASWVASGGVLEPGMLCASLTDGTVWKRTSSGWRALADIADFPVAVLLQSSGQSGLVNGYRTLNFNSETLDTHSGHSTSSNTSRWTVPSGQSGIYAVQGAAVFAAFSNSLVYYGARVQVDGDTVPASFGNVNQAPSAATNVAASTDRHLLSLSAGQYVELQGYCTAGTWGTTVSAWGASYLAIERIR